jgi:predicted amidohydrolase YtcJ
MPAAHGAVARAGAVKQEFRAPRRADEILLGDVIALDDAGTRCEALAVADGRILALGNRQAVMELKAPHTKVRDFRGHTIIPGFNDTHAHLDAVGTRLQRPSLEGAGSVTEVLDKIRSLARDTPPGEWIVTAPLGTPPFYLEAPATLREGRMPHRRELDAAAPEHPVYIPAPSGYWGMPPSYTAMNSLALQRNGITRDSIPTAPTTAIEKDEWGEPSGVFVEHSFVNTLEADLLPAVPRFAYEQRRAGIQAALAAYHGVGTTSIYEGHGSAPEVIAAYRELRERGELTIRTALTCSPRWRTVEEAAVAMRDWMPLLRGRGCGDPLLRVAGVFLAHGGDPCVRRLQHRDLAHMGWSGYVQQANSTEEFEALCMLAGRYDLRVHTIVSDKLAALIPVLERVARHFPIGQRRWVLEHISRSAPQELEAVRRLGVATTLIPSQYLWKHGAPFLDFTPEQMDYLSPARQLSELGVPVAAGTDGSPCNPLFCMWAMTTRRERTSGRVLGPGGAAPNALALRLLTRAGAWLTFEENEKGQLRPGFHADVAVLSHDPLAVSGDGLRDIRCAATAVGGRWVHGPA